jgi:hypothetical protein
MGDSQTALSYLASMCFPPFLVKLRCCGVACYRWVLFGFLASLGFVWHRLASFGRLDLFGLSCHLRSICVLWRRWALFVIALFDFVWHRLASFGVVWHRLASFSVMWHSLSSFDFV